MGTSQPVLGPIIADVEGFQLTAADKKFLSDPRIGGVILFARNFNDVSQLTSLVRDIKQLRQPELLVMVDHEGGRVQRFHDGFTTIPPMAELGACYEQAPEQGLQLATACGRVLAAELTAVGIDLNLGPVLDLDLGRASVIGNRSFHQTPDIVAKLAGAVIKGMTDYGMAAVGKHFPGHGGVTGDSHKLLPTDTRTLDDLLDCDLEPYRQLGEGLAALMPAHIVFSAVDDKPVTYSKHWLQTVLRQQIGFANTVISDDLFMLGAAGIADPAARALAAVRAGIDLLLMCNNRKGVEQALAKLPDDFGLTPSTVAALDRLRAPSSPRSLTELTVDIRYQDALKTLVQYTMAETIS